MDSGAAGDVEDPALAPVAHARHDHLGQLERGPDLDLEHQPIALLGELGERDVARHRGVVDEDVDRAEGLDRLVDHPLPILGPGDVGLDRDGSATGGPDAIHRLGQRSLVLLDRLQCARRHRHLGAGGGEALGDRRADAAAGSGDQRNPSFQLPRHGTRCQAARSRMWTPQAEPRPITWARPTLRLRSGDHRLRRAGGGTPPRCWRCRWPRSGAPWTAGHRRR